MRAVCLGLAARRLSKDELWKYQFAVYSAECDADSLYPCPWCFEAAKALLGRLHLMPSMISSGRARCDECREVIGFPP